MKCTLSEDINKCPFCNKEKMECHNEHECTFQGKEEEKKSAGYVRKERWYEKYYRDK